MGVFRERKSGQECHSLQRSQGEGRLKEVIRFSIMKYHNVDILERSFKRISG